MAPSRRAWGWGRRAPSARRWPSPRPRSTRSRGCARGSDFKAGLCTTQVSGRGSYSNFFGNSSRAGLLNSCQEQGRSADWPSQPGAGQVLGPSPAAPAPRRGTFSFASPSGPERGGHLGGLDLARCPRLRPGLWPLSAAWAQRTGFVCFLTWRSAPRPPGCGISPRVRRAPAAARTLDALPGGEDTAGSLRGPGSGCASPPWARSEYLPWPRVWGHSGAFGDAALKARKARTLGVPARSSQARWGACFSPQLAGELWRRPLRRPSSSVP